MTLRQLLEAAEARRSQQWEGPAFLWALVAEVHRDREKRSKPYTAADVHPYWVAEEEKPKPLSELGKELARGS